MRQLAELVVADPSHIPTTVEEAIAVLNPIFERTHHPSGDSTDLIPADLIDGSTAPDAIEAAEEVMAWLCQLMGRQ